MPTRVETRGRSRALQALYAWDVRGTPDNLPRVAANVWDDLFVRVFEAYEKGLAAAGALDFDDL